MKMEAIARVKPGLAFPSETPPPLEQPGAQLSKKSSVASSEPTSPATRPRRGFFPPKNTMFFADLSEQAIDPELRNLADQVCTLPLEGEAGELATHLKRELLKMADDDSVKGTPRGDAPSRASRIAESGEKLASKLEEGPMVPRLSCGHTPDFVVNSRLTPVLLDTYSARLESLSKDQIRAENDRLRTEISSLRLEIRQRREESSRRQRHPTQVQFLTAKG
mmetsp:Transcript_88897/g.206882  ORF Transcript_88897/g.206882 Transcript_88897/m.206882 type:complete len:221 (-) Transcript_88897:99-761(-)|eukprot:CAMPEP_0171106718 /NCGR_PEP_ID=MMETSP0766_2-20121228/65352_1 /TAXON_ID=439317 /ORGANISM="Gambierdiscus australes, Strain CAWD 149" /LENGTH=220 /DNA_ID=CAMNT_0011567877 /DNA_START=100 /DNA_END=762 /DNA_ORIENTATION=+